MNTVIVQSTHVPQPDDARFGAFFRAPLAAKRAIPSSVVLAFYPIDRAAVSISRPLDWRWQG